MKKIFLFVALTFSMAVSAQKKITEGKITSKQSFSVEDEQMQAQLEAMMGEMKTTTFFKGSNSRSELDNPMSGKITTIINSAKNELLLLMNNPTLGKMYTLKKDLVNPEASKDIKVVKGDKTKTILGYKCQQYTVTITNDGKTVETIMYTTEEIPVVSQQTVTYKDKVPGFPMFMEMTMNQMGMEMLITTQVTNIESQPVSEDLFNTTPPEGYKNMEEK